MHPNPLAAKLGRDRAGEGELGVLRGGVGATRRPGDDTRDRDDVDDVSRCHGAQPRQEGPEDPDAAEVVDPDQPLDHLGIAVEEARASRDPGVVDQQIDPRVPLEHTRGDRLDGGTVGDVAWLGLAAQLLRERLESIGAAREQDAEVAPRREQAGDLDADARGGARDDSDPAHAKRLSL